MGGEVVGSKGVGYRELGLGRLGARCRSQVH